MRIRAHLHAGLDDRFRPRHDDDVRPGPGKIWNVEIGVGNHQVDIKREGGHLSDRLHHQRAHGLVSFVTGGHASGDEDCCADTIWENSKVRRNSFLIIIGFFSQ